MIYSQVRFCVTESFLNPGSTSEKQYEAQAYWVDLSPGRNPSERLLTLEPAAGVITL